MVLSLIRYDKEEACLLGDSIDFRFCFGFSRIMAFT